MIPTPKYVIGQTVFFAQTVVEQRQHKCPDCLGKGEWHVRSPAGTVYRAPCPRCRAAYQSNSALSLRYSAFAPYVAKLTIGSVRIDTARDDEPVEYMCRETGVGSGNVYRESRLFLTEDEAMEAATLIANEQNEKTPWIVEQWKGSLEFSDYQLLETVHRADHKALQALQWTMRDLIDSVNAAETLAEAQKAVAED